MPMMRFKYVVAGIDALAEEETALLGPLVVTDW